MAGFMERLTAVEKVIAVLVAAGVGYTTYQGNQLANRLKEQDVQLGRIERTQELEMAASKERREAAEFDNELTHKIFKEFVEAIGAAQSTPQDRMDRLTGVLVLTYAIPDVRQQDGMARAVQKAIERLSASNQQLAGQAKEASFDVEELLVQTFAEQKAVAPPPVVAAAGATRWHNYDIDVFWCEGVAESATMQSVAEKILALKAEDPAADGRWRLRPLPASVNERSGYRVQGIQIRLSSDDERKLGEDLKGLIGSRAAPGTAVALVPTLQATPWYLSVFVCP